MFRDATGKRVLLSRFLFTLTALLCFRLGVHIPTPGVDTKALLALSSQQAGFLKILNVFSGGALARFSVFGLGIMPYISASIIIQLLTVVVPAFEQMQKEGGNGRQRMNRIMRSLAVCIAFAQGLAFASQLESSGSAVSAVLDPGWSFRLTAALCMTAGTCLVMWLSDQITEKGIGNGSSLIIFAGIVSYFPSGVATVIQIVKENPSEIIGVLGLLAFLLFIVFGVAFIEQSYRKIPIHFAKRTIGNRAIAAPPTHLPLKVNMAGVIPAIFASTLLSIPLTIVSWGNRSLASSPIVAELYPNRWLYNVGFALLVLFFSYVYTSITFKPDDIADNLKKQSAYIPGIRPGTETAEALDYVVSRLTLAGAVYMNFVAVLPATIVKDHYANQLALGGTSILIVVGVALDTMRQIEGQLATQRYDDLMVTAFGKQPEPAH